MSTAPGRSLGGVTLVALLLGVFIGSVIVILFLRKPPEPPLANPAVQEVLRAYERLADKYLAAKPDTTPAQYVWAMGQLCEALERQDMSECPRDFRVACEQNIRAIRDAKAILERCPDGFLQGVAMGAMNYLVRGEADGGLSRLENDVQAALRRIRFTSDEVERIASKYTY